MRELEVLSIHPTLTPTEALNNLIKRAGFGFRDFSSYRIRLLLYVGKRNWNPLATAPPHLYPMSVDPARGALVLLGLAHALHKVSEPTRSTRAHTQPAA